MADSDGALNGSRAFSNRQDAGVKLAVELTAYRTHAPIVLGLVRGGVPVARVVARALGAPLGAFVALKLHVPGQPEIAAGAVAPGVRFFVDEIVRELEISADYLTIAAEALEKQLEQRSKCFSAASGPVLTGRTVIMVDDGIASGATAVATIQSVRRAGARHIVFAAPVASRAGLTAVGIADEVVVPVVPRDFRAVSDVYDDFGPISDDDVRALLAGARSPA